MLSKSRIILLVIVCTMYTAIKSAEPRQERTMRYIVYSYDGHAYLPIVKAIARGLQLSEPADENIIFVEHESGKGGSIGFKDTIDSSHNVDWVCIAHYDKCRPVAEQTRAIAERPSVNFHSIIFFDSYPIERPAGAVTEKISNTFKSIPLDIKFEKVLHRVYNFYSEEASYWYRKIYPADKVVSSGRLDIATWGPERYPYLKGVNIKCFSIARNNTLNPFNFSKQLGWIKGWSDYGPSDALVQAARSIEHVIRTADETYYMNTDLACILANESLVTKSDVIPSRNNPAPIVINRPTYWNGTSLSQIIASEKWLSWLSWGIVGAKTLWELEIAADQRPAIYTAIAREADINARYNSRIPYFRPWLQNYRSSITAITAISYEWFSQFARVNNAPYKNDIAAATVPLRSTRGHMSTQEREFLAARTPFVCETLRRLGLPTNKIPKIAIVASGGGIRAMLATLGVLRGFERVGLLDAITYVCCLSGSTWAIGPWITSGLGVQEYCTTHNIIDKVANFTSPSLYRAFEQRYIKTQENIIKAVFGQPFTWVDVWGQYISKNLLISPDMTLSQQAAQVINGRKPLPIYTAVTIDARARDWFEFTPFEVGSINKNIYIPSWSFGRYFISGVSQDFPPEQSFGYLMGIFGSAMGAEFKSVLTGAGLSNLTAAEWSMTHAIVPNFYFGIRDIPGSDNDFIQLVDAGAAFNLPYPPISGINADRKADIVIFIDASGEFGQEVGGEMRKTVIWQQQAERTSGVHLPVQMATWSSAPQQPGQVPLTRQERAKVFNGDPVGNVPTIIYIPIILNSEEEREWPFTQAQRDSITAFDHTHAALLRTYTNENLMNQYPTSTFNYTSDKSNFLLDLMSLHVEISAQKMLNAIEYHCRRMP